MFDSTLKLSSLILKVFELNGLCLAVGERLAIKHGLTAARWQVLGAIVESGGATVAQIGRSRGLTRQSVQRTVDILAEQGFVEFKSNPEHLRAKLVYPSKKGVRVFKRLMDDFSKTVGGLEAELKQKEVDSALRLMQHIAHSLSGVK